MRHKLGYGWLLMWLPLVPIYVSVGTLAACGHSGPSSAKLSNTGSSDASPTTTTTAPDKDKPYTIDPYDREDIANTNKLMVVHGVLCMVNTNHDSVESCDWANARIPAIPPTTTTTIPSTTTTVLHPVTTVYHKP